MTQHLPRAGRLYPYVPTTRAVWRAGFVLGIGMGGFLDGIVLHQILQWHQMLSSRVPPVDLPSVHLNIRWDGLFHLGLWLVVAYGLKCLWHASMESLQRVSGRVVIGAMICGWGVFNVFEGVINHQLLGLHHVNELSPDRVAWDAWFLVASVLLAALGWRITRINAPWRRA